MIEVGPRTRRQQVLKHILRFGSVRGARTQPAARSRANRRRRLMGEIIEKRLRTSGLGLRSRPSPHHKRELIAKRGKLRQVRFLIRARRIELQERVRLVAEPPARTLDKLLGRGGLKEKCSFVLVRSAQQRHIVLLTLGEYSSDLFRKKPSIDHGT